MKRFVKVAATVAAACAVLGATQAQAVGSVSVTVNATIVGVCKFNSSQSPVVNITNTSSGSNIDPSLTADAVGTAAVLYRCTNGTTPDFVTGNPTSATLTSGSNNMSAGITYTSGGAGAGFNTDKTLTVTGTITSATYASAAVGAYTGTITVNINP